MKVLILFPFIVFFGGGFAQTQSCVNKVAIPQCLPALANYLQSQASLLQNLSQELQTAKQETEKVKASLGQWPAGSYCILASGGCPKGFTKKSGHMRALNMYSHTPTYIQPVHFGSSRITCHGKCGQYGNWVGDLYISACCK
ncbi:uncharacterized protein LOC116288220 isoform X2 [Actinia tenebrosa]|uniref:Uncharacterized protein LOC116288220 isoform X2 n=1 Tax=Actinia tenebrosa TaxID=6105 RepID=A0A6P8HDX9_ACTTE|nr:uncharacterized protein LOC116288220 isoform X2 [Actinia tenebrosa]